MSTIKLNSWGWSNQSVKCLLRKHEDLNSMANLDGKPWVCWPVFITPVVWISGLAGQPFKSTQQIRWFSWGTWSQTIKMESSSWGLPPKVGLWSPHVSTCIYICTHMNRNSELRVKRGFIVSANLRHWLRSSPGGLKGFSYKYRRMQWLTFSLDWKLCSCQCTALTMGSRPDTQSTVLIRQSSEHMNGALAATWAGILVKRSKTQL